MHHLELLLYVGRNNAEILFLALNDLQEVHAEIQLNLNRYCFYLAHLQLFSSQCQSLNKLCHIQIGHVLQGCFA